MQQTAKFVSILVLNQHSHHKQFRTSSAVWVMQSSVSTEQPPTFQQTANCTSTFVLQLSSAVRASRSATAYIILCLLLPVSNIVDCSRQQHACHIHSSTCMTLFTIPWYITTTQHIASPLSGQLSLAITVMSQAISQQQVLSLYIASHTCISTFASQRMQRLISSASSA